MIPAAPQTGIVWGGGALQGSKRAAKHAARHEARANARSCDSWCGGRKVRPAQRIHPQGNLGPLHSAGTLLQGCSTPTSRRGLAQPRSALACGTLNSSPHSIVLCTHQLMWACAAAPL